MADRASIGRSGSGPELCDQSTSHPSCGFCRDEPWTVSNGAGLAGGDAAAEVHCPRCGRSNKETPPAKKKVSPPGEQPPVPAVDPDIWESRRARPARPIRPFPKERDQPKRKKRSRA